MCLQDVRQASAQKCQLDSTYLQVGATYVICIKAQHKHLKDLTSVRGCQVDDRSLLLKTDMSEVMSRKTIINDNNFINRHILSSIKLMETYLFSRNLKIVCLTIK